MAWSYSGNPASGPRDLVRFLCGDTDELMPLLTDEEIDYLLTEKPNPKAVAWEACERILAKLGKEVDYSIGPERVEASQRLGNYRRLAHTLKSNLVNSHAYPIGHDVGRGDGIHVGMHDIRGGYRG